MAFYCSERRKKEQVPTRPNLTNLETSLVDDHGSIPAMPWNEQINTARDGLDCKQSLSFPSVFRAIERKSRGEWCAANREKCGHGEKEKDRDCGGIFDLFDLLPLTPV